MTESKGKVEELGSFSSQYVPARNIEIYLPPNYSQNKKYPVIYMHDGQNVFNPETSTHQIDWGVDETMDSLITNKLIEPAIVVAAWCTDNRRNEYMPQDCIETPDSLKADPFFTATGFTSNNYLRFLVEELKPHIEANYSIKPGRENTYIMGSSMGGLISLYAACKYPEIFGGVGSISTHWPAGDGIVINWLKNNLPAAGNIRIYFDHGTETLDSGYAPYQQKMDAIMLELGHKKGSDWVSQVFEGASHDEASWNDRVHVPLQFLIGKK